MNNNDVKISIDKMRKGGYRTDETEKKKLYTPSMRDLLKITRKLYENVEDSEVKINKATPADQKREEELFNNAFSEYKMITEFQPLKVYDDYILWGGTINNSIQFMYKITPNEDLNNVVINYLKDFQPDDPDNKEIVDKLEKYYDEFFKRWGEYIEEK